MFSTPFTFLKAASAGYDPDAQAFFDAIAGDGVTLTETEKNAVNTLTLSMKSASLFSKMKAIHPVVGSVYNSHKYNLKDPRDLDAAFRLTDIGTDPITHTSNGFYGTANTNATAVNTHFNPNTEFASRSLSFGYYCNGNPTISAGADNYLMGAYSGSGSFLAAQLGGGSNNIVLHFTGNGTTNNAVLPQPDPTNRYLGFNGFSGDVATGNTFLKLYNSTTDSTATNAGTLSGTSLPSVPFYLCNLNLNGTIYSGYHGEGQVGQIAFSFVGDALSQAEMDSFKVIVQDYQIALGRSI